MTNKVDPLNWNIPIADARGCPTPEFQRKWLQQAATNSSIPPPGVVSVGLSAPAQFSVAGSPITAGTSGTLALAWANETANLVLAGPGSGGAAAPTFRSLVAADLPLFSSSLNGAVPSSGGGTTNFLRADGTWNAPGGGGGGYSPGTVPTVVQTAFTTNGGNSVTFGAAPTNGNLLVAMAFNPSSPTAGTGWTQQVDQPSGTDYGVILTKVAGAGESTTQSPITGNGSTGAIMVWELHGQHATSPFVTGLSQVEQSGVSNTPILLPNVFNCIGLAAIGVVPSPTISTLLNAGTQDVLSNTNTRYLGAGHTDLSKTPMVGLMAILSGTANSKGATCLVTS